MTVKLSRRQFISIAGTAAATLALDWKKIEAYGAGIDSIKDHPVVVIGAGLGGLTSAAYLARQGFPVTLVEKHAVPGGYATTFDRAAGKFTFEVSLHGTSINHNRPAKILDELGVLEKIQLVALPEMYRIKSPLGEVVVPQRDPGAFTDTLAKKFPGDAAGIKGFVDTMVGIYQETEAWGNKSDLGRTLSKAAFPMLFPKMWKVRNQTLAQMLDDHVSNGQAREFLAFLCGYYGLPPSRLSAFYYCVATGGYLVNGSYYIRGGSQQLSNALAETIEDTGGTIHYETEAMEVLVEKDGVTGVRIDSGQVLPARAVVCNASAPALFSKMVPRKVVPANYRRKLQSYQPSISSFMVWLGLNRPLRGVLPWYSTSVSTGASADEDYGYSLEGAIDRVSYSVCIYDNLYAGYSAPGTSTLMLMTLSGYEPWRRFEADYRAGRKEAYHREKNRWAKALIGRVEKDLIPGLAAMIEVQEAATPLTNWHYTGSTEGAIYGYEQSMQNAYMNRIENRTPVKGLYLAGAWGNPGGGFAAVLRSGQETFLNIMQDATA